MLDYSMDTKQTAILRYDGRYEFIQGENRQWTIQSHYIDQNGCDRYRGSFTLDGLREIGVIA